MIVREINIDIFNHYDGRTNIEYLCILYIIGPKKRRWGFSYPIQRDDYIEDMESMILECKNFNRLEKEHMIQLLKNKIGEEGLGKSEQEENLGP